MKYFTSDSVVKNSWESVVTAFWQRYPNAYSRHVLSEDTFYRRCDPENGHLLTSKRFIHKTNPIPKWGRRLGVNVKDVGIVEETLLDLKNRFLVSYTRNVNCLGMMAVDEKVSYRPHPENPQFTEVKREAWIASQMRGVSAFMEKFGLERFKHNSVSAMKGFKQVLSRMYPPPEHAIEHLAQSVKGGKRLVGGLMAQKLGKVKDEARHISSKEVL